MKFYSGGVKRLLTRMQVCLKGYITTKDTFPDPPDFQYELERRFDEQVKHSVRKKGVLGGNCIWCSVAYHNASPWRPFWVNTWYEAARESFKFAGKAGITDSAWSWGRRVGHSGLLSREWLVTWSSITMHWHLASWIFKSYTLKAVFQVRLILRHQELNWSRHWSRHSEKKKLLGLLALGTQSEWLTSSMKLMWVLVIGLIAIC